MAVPSAFEMFVRDNKRKNEEENNCVDYSEVKKKSSKKRRVSNNNKKRERKETESEDTENDVHLSPNNQQTSKTRKRKYMAWVQQKQAEMRSAKIEDELRQKLVKSIPKSPEYKITPKLSIPFKEQFFPHKYKDSRNGANALFELLIHPFSLEQFQKKIWEKKPLLIPRESPLYNNGWFSSEELNTILQEKDVAHGVNINISSYIDGEKELEEMSGRAYATTVWERFQSGYSIQFLNPQSFSDSMWLLTSTLQEHFGSFVGANIYLTPPDSQGFAPHYDDIEAFILQVEGKKHWRVYRPKELLPRFSSRDFSQDEIGEPILDVTLEPGDLLYFPRGYIHQATTVPDYHSLHITLSTCQRNTWGDLLEKWVSKAVKSSIEEDSELRQSLPWDYMDYTGFVHSDMDDPRAKDFYSRLHDLFFRIVSSPFPLLSAVDEMSVDFLHSSLPPCLTEKEKESSVFHQGSITNKKEPWSYVKPITLDTRIKLIRSKAVRLVSDVNDEQQDSILYYSTSNSRVYKERDSLGITLTDDSDETAIRHLIKRYPHSTAVRDLPMDTDEKKVSLCTTLYEQNIIICLE